MWQPYEAELSDLPTYCIAGKAVWTATVLLVCFHLVEKHTSNRVVLQFGMVQEISQPINTDVVLHKIDLRRKSVLIGHKNMLSISSIGVIDSKGGVMQCLVICLLTMSTSTGSIG